MSRLVMKRWSFGFHYWNYTIINAKIRKSHQLFRKRNIWKNRLRFDRQENPWRLQKLGRTCQIDGWFWEFKLRQHHYRYRQCRKVCPCHLITLIYVRKGHSQNPGWYIQRVFVRFPRQPDASLELNKLLPGIVHLPKLKWRAYVCDKVYEL